MYHDLLQGDNKKKKSVLSFLNVLLDGVERQQFVGRGILIPFPPTHMMPQLSLILSGKSYKGREKGENWHHKIHLHWPAQNQYIIDASSV